MIGLLGVAGANASLPYRGGLSVESDRPTTFTRTLAGKRKSFVGRASRREWSVDVDLIGASATQGLVAVARAVSGVYWYPADATTGNMLSPQATGAGVVPSRHVSTGLATLPDGSVADVFTRTEAGAAYIGNAHGTYEMVPVVAGKPVAVGAWASGDFRVSFLWRNTSGGAVSSTTGALTTGSGWSWRSVTATAPTGAAFVAVSVGTSTAFTRPSVTWGSVALDRPGRGCPAAVVSGLSESLTVIRPGDAYGSIGFTVTEVG